MSKYLYEKGICIFDYPEFAKGLRDKLRQHIESLAKESGIEIQYLQSGKIRKESFVSTIVCILSTLEYCNAHQPWHDKKTGKTFLNPDDTKCNH
jgi:hypothetical protein